MTTKVKLIAIDMPYHVECGYQYLTLGKEYDIKLSRCGNGGTIVNDNGEHNFILIDMHDEHTGCVHSWQIIEGE